VANNPINNKSNKPKLFLGPCFNLKSAKVFYGPQTRWRLISIKNSRKTQKLLLGSFFAKLPNISRSEKRRFVGVASVILDTGTVTSFVTVVY